jgi:anti-sigma B factor antagonist
MALQLMSAMHEPFDIHVDRVADRATLAIGGELDVGTAPELRGAVGELLGSGVRHAIFDLGHVTFADSSGLGALVWAVHRFAAAGGDVRVERLSPTVERVVEVSGLRDLLAPRAPALHPG